MQGSENKQSKAFVTGALGFVGKHLAQRLVERGDEVCLADIQEHDQLPGSASYHRVDVCDYGSVRAALEGVDTVFHVASLVQTRQCDAQKVWAVNFDGTKNVIRACREAGVKRLVYVSSASVVYEGRNIENGDESLPYASISQAPYADSKIAAEKAVLEAHEDGVFHTCAIRPHVVFGPGDGRFFPALVKRAEQGSLKYGVGRGRKVSDFTYIDNLIDALIAADEKLALSGETGGEAFFITNGEPMPFWDFVDKVLVALNKSPTKGRIPFRVAYCAAMIAETIASFRSNPVLAENGLTRFAIRYMCTHHYFSIEKARHALGYEPRVDIDEGIARTVAHLQLRT